MIFFLLFSLANLRFTSVGSACSPRLKYNFYSLKSSTVTSVSGPVFGHKSDPGLYTSDEDCIILIFQIFPKAYFFVRVFFKRSTTPTIYANLLKKNLKKTFKRFQTWQRYMTCRDWLSFFLGNVLYLDIVQ